MRVKAGLDGKWVDGTEEAIVVQLTGQDVRNIRRMGYVFTCYAQLPAHEQVRLMDGGKAVEEELREKLFSGAVSTSGDGNVPQELMEGWLQFRDKMPPYSVGDFVRINGFSNGFVARHPVLVEQIRLDYGVVVAVDVPAPHGRRVPEQGLNWCVTLLMLNNASTGKDGKQGRKFIRRRFSCTSVDLQIVDIPWKPCR